MLLQLIFYIVEIEKTGSMNIMSVKNITHIFITLLVLEIHLIISLQGDYHQMGIINLQEVHILATL